MGKEAKLNTKKNEVLERVMDYLRKAYETDVEKVGTSEAMMPAVDENGNEFYYKIQISVPRGTRNANGTYNPYNGYDEATEWKEKVADDEAKRAVKEQKKAEAIAKREALRQAKQTVKELNKKGLNKMIKEGE